MKTNTLIVLLLSVLIQYSYSENPGYVMDVKLPVINKVRDRYFDEVFENFGQQDIPDVTSGKLKVYDIKVALSNSSPNNLNVGFDEPNNGVAVKVDDTYVSIKCNFRYKKSIIKFKGSIDLHGTLKSIGLNLGFDALEESGYYVPQLKMNSFDFDMPKSNFKLKLKCKGCPKFVQDLISTFAKDPLIVSIRNQIRKTLPTQLITAGNRVLVTSYPRTVNLYNDINLCTAMSGPIMIKSDYAQVPLDGTLFLTEDGYHRTGSAPDIPIYNEKDPGELQMFFSSYLPTSLDEILNKKTQQYKVKYQSQTYILELNPEKGKTTLTFEDGDFKILASPTITMPNLGLSLFFSASAMIQPEIDNGDDTHMLYVHPKVGEVKINNVELIMDGSSIDLSKYSGKTL